MTSWRVCGEKSRSRPISGSATTTMYWSSDTTSIAKASRARVPALPLLGEDRCACEVMPRSYVTDRNVTARLKESGSAGGAHGVQQVRGRDRVAGVLLRVRPRDAAVRQHDHL